MQSDRTKLTLPATITASESSASATSEASATSAAIKTSSATIATASSRRTSHCGRHISSSTSLGGTTYFQRAEMTRTSENETS